jgi:hypothetical protein
MAVAIAIDAILDDVAGQHLHLADFACPGAGGAVRVEIAMADHLDGCDQLRPEQFRPAAIMRQRHQRVHGVEIALHRAEIGLQAPEGGDDGGRHAVFGLCAGEGLGVLLHLPLGADLHAVGADRAFGEFEEGLAEHALGAVAREHLAVDRGVAQRLVRHLGADAFGNGLGLHPFEKGAEIAAAGGACAIAGVAARLARSRARESFDVMMAWQLLMGRMNGPRICGDDAVIPRMRKVSGPVLSLALADRLQGPHNSGFIQTSGSLSFP